MLTKKNATQHNWSWFSKELKSRFEIVNSEELARDRLAELKQNTSVQVYVNEFLTITNMISDISEAEKKDRFERGLKPKIRQQLATLKVLSKELTLEQMMTQAERLDRQLEESFQTKGDTNQESNVVLPVMDNKSHQNKESTKDAMELDAYNFRRQPGYCPKCGRGKHWANDCPTNKKVYPSKRPNSNKIHSTYSHPQTTKMKIYKLSNDGTSSSVLVLQGELDNHPVKVLIDSGATHDFISSKFVKRVMLPTQLLPNKSKLIFGDGSTVQIAEKTKANLKIQKHQTRRNLIVAPINNYDIILGQSWLKQVNPRIDWKKKTVTIKKGRLQPIILTANHNSDNAYLNEMLLSTLQVKKALRNDEEMFLCLIQPIPTEQQCNSTEMNQAPEDNSDKAERLKTAYQDIFGDLPKGLPPDRFGIEHHIRLKPESTIPPSRPPYRMSPAETDELKRQLQELVDKQFIQPSSSPYASPVLFVKKKNGKLRMCIDYRGINKITVKNNYPLPKIDELLDRLHGAKVFSKLDLSSGYYQVKIAEEDIEKTAFCTRYGLFEFRVLPFGLTGAPSTFMSLMNRVFYDYLDKFVIVYLDDILVYSKNEEEHEEHLKLILNKLREHRLIVNKEKSELFKKKVTFLGFDIDEHGIHTEKSKVKAIEDWPTPATKQELRSFLGVANFYRRFIRNYSLLAKPLTDIQGENRIFVWEKEQQRAFQQLKHALISAPTLASPDPTKNYQLYVDASDYAVGGVLCQETDGIIHPIAFESHKLSKAEQNYATHEKEMLAIIYCLNKWRHYLESRKTTVITDHHSLQYLHNQPKLSRKQARWMELIANFDIEIKYMPGRMNIVADALSRRSDHRTKSISATSKSSSEYSVFLHAATNFVPELLQKFKSALTNDVYYNRKKDKLPSYLVLMDGLLFKKHQNQLLLYVPLSMRNTILQESHENGGHGGVKKTQQIIKRAYWWPSWYREVYQYVRSCFDCQTAKSRNHSTYGLLKSLPVPIEKWKNITMDFITELPKTKEQYDCIMVVVDRLTKMAKFIPTTTNADAPAIAKLFFDTIFRNYGLPEEVVSDRDPKFRSLLWQSLMKMCGTKLSFSTSYHPQTDGQTERTNRTLEEMLRSYCTDNQDDWANKLTLVEFHYNNTINSSTGFTPFYLAYGFNPKLPLFVLSPYSDSPNVQTVDEYIEMMKKTTESAKKNIEKALKKQTFYANKRRKDIQFQEGDMVLLSTTNLRLHGSRKLNPKFVGPFKIIKKISDVNYKLELTYPFQNIHDVFHVSLLKKYVEDQHNRRNLRPPPELIDGENQYEVEKIVDKRIKTVKKKQKIEYLVKWKNYPSYENTWEPLENLAHCRESIEEFEHCRQH